MRIAYIVNGIAVAVLLSTGTSAFAQAASNATSLATGQETSSSLPGTTTTAPAAPTTAQQQPAAVAAQPAPVKQTVATTDDGADTIVCRTMAPATGTRLGARRVCQTQREWEAQRQEAQDDLTRRQIQIGTNGGN